MGERLPGQRSFVCSFFDCKAEFSKSWKLEAHLCKHTGLVSGVPAAGGDTVVVRLVSCSSRLRNRSPARAATGASALATS